VPCFQVAVYPPVDGQRYAGDVDGIVRGEVADGSGDVGGLGDAAERYTGSDVLCGSDRVVLVGEPGVV
jgi:hypothetical protein